MTDDYTLKTVIFREGDKAKLKIGDKIYDGDGLMFATEDNEGRLAMANIGMWPFLAKSCIKNGIIDNLDFPTAKEFLKV